jgi:putative oxidoreductase
LIVGEGREESSRRGSLKRATTSVHHAGTRAQLQGWGLTILRVVTGIVFLISGGHKLLSTNTGLYALAEELGELPLPLLAATAGAPVLFLCGSALVLGLFTRLVSVALAVVMVVDILLFHPPTGAFFVEDGGYEYALLRLAACVALVVAGGGKAALSSVLSCGRRGRRPSCAYYARPTTLGLLRWLQTGHSDNSSNLPRALPR